jgi:hypothetical protein
MAGLEATLYRGVQNSSRPLPRYKAIGKLGNFLGRIQLSHKGRAAYIRAAFLSHNAFQHSRRLLFYVSETFYKTYVSTKKIVDNPFASATMPLALVSEIKKWRAACPNSLTGFVTSSTRFLMSWKCSWFASCS